MSSDKFSNKYSELQDFTESCLQQVYPDSSDILSSACRYSLLSPGKRIRPVLALASGELLKIEQKALAPFSVALECLHAASLIHDDLPALDNDELRRGQPTCHVIYGEAVALLAGDALIGKASELVLKAEALDDRAKVALGLLLSETTARLCEGQVLDIGGKGRRDEAHLEQCQALKTGALLEASAAGPALVLGGLETEQYQQFSEFGQLLGRLFQVVDDVLDATASTVEMGKVTSRDEAEDRLTYVSLYGLDGAKERATSLSADAIAALEGFAEDAWFLRELVHYVYRRMG